MFEIETLVSHPLEAIAAYVFAKYFFLGLCRSDGYGGTPWRSGVRLIRPMWAAAVLIMSDSTGN